MRLAAALATVLALAGPADADWGPKRDPFDRGVIARYQAILAKDPYDPALAQLAAMYKRYRTLDALIAEYDATLASGSGDGTALVIVARLIEDKQPASALAAYRRAWSVRTDDRKLALKIAALERDAKHLAEAEQAYERALAGPTRKDALRGLFELAAARRDRVAMAFLAKQLGELEPRDPRAQLERGDTMLSIGLLDAALEAYASAEKLYATDPVRRVETVIRRAKALEERDRSEAETEYRRALALLPKGHYLRTEVFGRLVELHRSAGTLGALLAISLEEWPVASRGALEWHELAELYDAVGEQDHAIAAYEEAVKRSPEPRLHLALADHYPKARAADMLVVLDRLVARSRRDLWVLTAVAERLAKWGHLAKAIAIYDQALALDPAAADRMIDLVDESFRASKQSAAIALARSVTPKLRTGAAHGRLGKIQLEWGRYRDAIASFGRAIAIEPTEAEHYRGRAAARDAIHDTDEAVKDGRRVLDLAGLDPALRRAARKELVRIVVHASAESGERASHIGRWRDAFDAQPPDVEAGFLLLDYFGVAPCDPMIDLRHSCRGEVARVLFKLARLGPIDPDDIIAIATAYAAAGQHDEAIQILETLRKIAPDREVDLIVRIGRINQWRSRFDPTVYGPVMNGEEVVDPEAEIRATVRRHRREVRVAVAEPLRLGLKLGYGSGLRGGSQDRVSAGLAVASALGRDVFLTMRFDLSKHDFNSAGGSIGIAKSLLTTQSTTLVLGFAERLERRWDLEMTRDGYDTVGLAAEATLDLVGRKLPAGLGARLEQGMSDGGRSTALMFEATVELR